MQRALVEVVAGNDVEPCELWGGEAGGRLLEPAAHCDGQRGQVARVEADTEGCIAQLTQGEGAGEEVGDARPERVVGVDEGEEAPGEGLAVADA